MNTGLAVSNSISLQTEPKAEQWVTVRKCAELINTTERTIQRYCVSGKYITRRVVMNGGTGYEIALSSLPVKAQTEYFKQNGFDRSQDRQQKAIDPNDPMAIARTELVLQYAKVCESTDLYGEKTAVKEAFARDYKYRFPELFEAVGEVSRQTLDRWLKMYNEAGCDGSVLSNRYLGRQNSITEEETKLLLMLYLNPNELPLKQVIRVARKIAYENDVMMKLSDVTYYRFLKEFEKKHWDASVYGRKGLKALHDRGLFSLERDYDMIEFGDIWVADGHDLNFTIAHPSTGRPVRMTLIQFFDMKTGIPLGFEIMPSENTAAIASALRRSILMAGRMVGAESGMGFKPKVIYLDNGKAFRSQYFSGVKDLRTAGLTGLFAMLNIEVTYAIVRNAKAKTVERFFKSFNDFERTIPSYVGTNALDKPAYMKQGEKGHLQLFNRINYQLTVRSASEMIIQWFDDFCNRQHQGGFYKGLSPFQVFEKSIDRLRASNAIGDRMISRSDLDFLMMVEKDARLTKDGFKLNGGRYYAEELHGWKPGERFTVRYDQVFDNDRILVYDPQDNSFVCEAFRMERTHPNARILGTEADVKLLSDQMAMKNRLIKQTKEKVRSVWEWSDPLVNGQAESVVYPQTESEDKVVKVKDKKISAEPREDYFDRYLKAINFKG